MKSPKEIIVVLLLFVLVLATAFLLVPLNNKNNEIPIKGPAKQNPVAEERASEKKRAPTKEDNRLAEKIVDVLTPSPTTAGDWSRLKIESGNVSNSNIRFWFLTHLRPVLQADTNTTGFHTKASSVRTASGNVVTTLWSNKIDNSLAIDWAKGVAEIDRQKQKFDNGPLFSELHDDQKLLDNPAITFGVNPSDDAQTGIGYKAIFNGKKVVRFIPYDRSNYSTIMGFIAIDYPIAVLPKITKEGRVFQALIVVDLTSAQILGEIKRPEGTQNGMPNFILDRKNDVLLVLQFGLDWLLAIDLRPHIEKLKQNK